MLLFCCCSVLLGLLPVAPSTTSTIFFFKSENRPPPPVDEFDGDFFNDINGFLPGTGGVFCCSLLLLFSFFNSNDFRCSVTMFVGFMATVVDVLSSVSSFLTIATKLSGNRPILPFSSPFHQPGSCPSLLIIVTMSPCFSVNSSSFWALYGYLTSHNCFTRKNQV